MTENQPAGRETEPIHAEREGGEAPPWWSSTERDPWSPRPESPRPEAPQPEPSQPQPEWAPPRPEAQTIADPWSFTDSLGREQRSSDSRRTGLLVALAAAIALLAGTAGGAAGYLLAERDDSQVTVDGAKLGTKPAGNNVARPDGSIPGVAAEVLPSVVQIKVSTSQGQATGSGFVIDDKGILVTNNHVVADAQSGVEISFTDGTTTDAKVLGTSPSYDLAVLRIDAKNLPALPLGNSDAVAVGDQVLAVGSPLGLSGTVTSGIVSAKNRPVSAGAQGSGDAAYINAIQTDAAINPGNSGGPLVNLNGEVIGVNSAIATVGGGGLGGESGNIGVGFAIPINQVRLTVSQLLRTGRAQFPIIGASLDGRYDGEGARVATDTIDGHPPLVPGGPAEKAGIHPGDVVVALDGEAVQDSSELIVAIRSHAPGDTVTLTVRRGGDERDIKVTLGSTEG